MTLPPPLTDIPPASRRNAEAAPPDTPLAPVRPARTSTYARALAHTPQASAPGRTPERRLSRAPSYGRVRSAGGAHRATDPPEPTREDLATPTPPTLHGAAGVSRRCAPCLVCRDAAPTTNASGPLPPSREHDSRAAQSTPPLKGASISTDPTTTALRCMSAHPGAPSPRIRTGRSTRSVLRGSPNGTTPPTMGAPNRTSDAHRSAVHDGLPCRTRPGTTARSHPGQCPG